MNTIVNSIIKNTIAQRSTNVSSLKAAASSTSNTTSATDNGLNELNSGTLATGIAVGVLTLVLIVFFIAVIIHYRMIRKLPEPVFESYEEKLPPRPARTSKSSQGHMNNLYLAPTKNYNPKLERITEDISSISNSVDSNLKIAGAKLPSQQFAASQQQHTSQSSRRASTDELSTGPTTLVNTNLDLNNNSTDFSSIKRAEPDSGVILSVRRIESPKHAPIFSQAIQKLDEEDVEAIAVYKASL